LDKIFSRTVSNRLSKKARQMKTTQALRFLVSVTLCLIASSAYAASDYRCVVARRISAGQESVDVQKMQENTYIGKEFTVERQTGFMAGILKFSSFTKPQIIDSGSTDNSFKVISSMRAGEGMGSGTSIYALTINEYERSDKKAFVFLVSDIVYLGTCKHF
jgi:hypothetical protein